MGVFHPEVVKKASTPLDSGLLREVRGNQLLRPDDGGEQMSLELLLSLGEVALQQLSEMKSLLPFDPRPEKFLPLSDVFSGHEGSQFFAVVQLGVGQENQLPAMVKVVRVNGQLDLQYSIVPIPMSALAPREHERTSDSKLALLAVALSAQQSIESLANGATTTHCGTKKKVVGGLDPSHSVPLAALFSGITNPDIVSQNGVYRTARAVVGSNNPTLGEVTHLHGLAHATVHTLSSQATEAKLGGGVPIARILRSKAGGHVLRFKTSIIDGVQQLETVTEVLARAQMMEGSLAMAAVVFAMTSHVLGNSQSEKKVQRLFTSDASTLLGDLVMP